MDLSSNTWRSDLRQRLKLIDEYLMDDMPIGPVAELIANLSLDIVRELRRRLSQNGE